MDQGLAALRNLLLSAWRGLPRPVRASAHVASARFLAATLPLLVHARWRRTPTRANAQIVIGGFFRSTSGLGQGARLFTAALDDRLARVLDVTERLGVRANLPPAGDRMGSDKGPPVLLTHLNPPELTRLLQLTGASVLSGRRHIGYWAWELPRAPQSWRRACHYVDEVWVPSRFTAEAIRAIAPPGLPVRVVPHPVSMMPRGRADRARFGLPDDRTLVFAALDLRSTLARKNPFGALEAYAAATPGRAGDTLLVCKASNLDADPEAGERLRALMASRSDVVLLEENLSSLDMSSLIASTDIVLSMHRAEGFGLVLAEAMWLGKAVVATGWSGNMDFMDEETSVLIPYTMVPVSDAQAMYANATWAEPKLDHAAEKLAWLIRDADARRSLGEAARRRAEEVFEITRWRSRVDHFLDGR